MSQSKMVSAGIGLVALLLAGMFALLEVADQKDLFRTDVTVEGGGTSPPVVIVPTPSSGGGGGVSHRVGPLHAAVLTRGSITASDFTGTLDTELLTVVTVPEGVEEVTIPSGLDPIARAYLYFAVNNLSPRVCDIRPTGSQFNALAAYNVQQQHVELGGQDFRVYRSETVLYVNTIAGVTWTVLVCGAGFAPTPTPIPTPTP